MKLSLIVAMASNRAIGLNGQMPWHLSADLKHFKKVTMGAPILMGRKTFEAIGRPLPGRSNWLISRDPSYRVDGCTSFNDLSSALAQANGYPEVFVIGGATLYQALLPQADCLYLTEIHRDFAGDTFFPAIDRDDWQEVERLDVNDDRTVDFAYSFLKLVRMRRLR